MQTPPFIDIQICRYKKNSRSAAEMQKKSIGTYKTIDKALTAFKLDFK